MADYVRICPRCGHANPEYENACSACGHFIGMESAVPRPQGVEAESNSESETTDGVQSEREGRSGVVTPTRRFVPADDSFYLEHVTSDHIFTIKSGSVMGQSHETSEAEVQVPSDVEGSECLHRQHCRFDRQDGKWIVTPLDQSETDQDFTNPTYVNKKRVSPGERQVLNDGDVLRLSGVSFSVRFIR